eukprot:XP_001697364.1 predicted protein [Chlamydomonas reinhardtii]
MNGMNACSRAAASDAAASQAVRAACTEDVRLRVRAAAVDGGSPVAVSRGAASPPDPESPLIPSAAPAAPAASSRASKGAAAAPSEAAPSRCPPLPPGAVAPAAPSAASPSPSSVPTRRFPRLRPTPAAASRRRTAEVAAAADSAAPAFARPAEMTCFLRSGLSELGSAPELDVSTHT